MILIWFRLLSLVYDNYTVYRQYKAVLLLLVIYTTEQTMNYTSLDEAKLHVSCYF